MKIFKVLLATLLIVVAGVGAFAQNVVVKGRVLDGKGQGVAGVVVSDGFEVYKSKSDGSFKFEASERARFVFMTTPDGYEQVGEFWVPIAGSVANGDSVAGDKIAADGGKELVFRVEKHDRESYAFLHIGDTEARIHKDWVDVLKEYVVYNKPAFVVFNGDICYENGLKFHSRELTSANLGTRAVFTLGNHDLVDGAYGEELYEKLFGPVWYSFDNGGVHFVVIPVLYGDRKPSYSADDVYSWLKKDLDAVPEGMPVVLFNHHFTGYETDFLLKGEKTEVNLLDYNFKAYFYAHYHINLLERSETTGVTTIATMSPNKGGIDHTPSSFRKVSFDREGKLDSEIRYASLKGHIAATLFGKQVAGETGNSKGRTGIKVKIASGNVKLAGGAVSVAPAMYDLVVNVYDTRTDVESVTAATGGGEYLLEKVGDWTWRASLPADALRGLDVNGAACRVVVTARFANGTVVKSVARDYSYIDGGKAAPKVQWVASLGNHTFMTSPVVTDGLVISATFDDNGKGGSAIHAVSASDGSVVWRLPVANSIKNNMALCEGTLLACDVLGNVYAVEAVSGRLLWSRALREKELHPVYTQGVTVYDGVVYAGHGHYLSALKVADGSLLWKNSAWRGGVCTVASPVVEPESGVLLTAAYWTGRFAHNAATGELLWQKRDDDTRIADNSPVYYKGRFFYVSPGHIMEVDPVSGEELVKHRIDFVVNNNSRPVVTDSLLIVGTTDKGVVAFDRTNGYKVLWNFKTNPGLVYTAPYTKDFQMTVESGVYYDAAAGVVYFGANDGYLYSLDAKTGVFRWRMNLGAPVLSNIVKCDGTIYVTDFAGNVWAVVD